MQKRLKTGDKPNQYVPVTADEELYSEMERKVTKGRFILEKKQKFQMQ